MSGTIAAVLVRGTIHANGNVKKALHDLRLQQKHACVILKDTPTVRGSLALCKDYIAYGPIDDAMLKEIESKRTSLKNTDGKSANVYLLHAPVGGWGQTKKGYQAGGVVGLRSEMMSALLKKMI